MLRGVRFEKDRIFTHTVVMRSITGTVPRKNTTRRRPGDELNLREHQAFRRYAGHYMDVEEAFYEWVVERFERDAARWGV